MIEMLKRLSPVSITITAIKYPNDLGVFFWGEGVAPYSGRRIEISERLQHSQCIAVLSHEVGHALHYEKDNKHFENLNVVEREIYAHKYSLRFLLKYKQKESLRWMTKDIKERSCHNDTFEKILKHLVKLKLWQKCLDYVNNP